MSSTQAPLGPVSRLLDAVCWICALVAGCMMVFLIAIFGWLVWGRYVMNSTPTWVEQVSLVLVVWITFLGAAVGVRYRHHLSIDFVRDSFPGPLRIGCTILSTLLMVFFGAIMTWQGWELTVSSMDRVVPMLGIAESWRTLPIAICGLLMTLFSLEHLLAYGIGQRGDA